MTAREGMLKIIYESEDDALRFLRSPGPGDGNGLSACTTIHIALWMCLHLGIGAPTRGARVVLRTLWRRIHQEDQWKAVEHQFLELKGREWPEPLTEKMPGRFHDSQVSG
ncbi:MAG TPA: hypothetical protein DCP69_02400 [Candidatus Omnitrophica bacterium]|nr:hypothetical protein [Candidatus Omnitrophota bacterium]